MHTQRTQCASCLPYNDGHGDGRLVAAIWTRSGICSEQWRVQDLDFEPLSAGPRPRCFQGLVRSSLVRNFCTMIVYDDCATMIVVRKLVNKFFECHSSCPTASCELQYFTAKFLHDFICHKICALWFRVFSPEPKIHDRSLALGSRLRRTVEFELPAKPTRPGSRTTGGNSSHHH